MIPDRHHALLGPLPHDANASRIDVHVVHVKGAELGDAHSTGVQELQDRSVAQDEWVAASGGLDEICRVGRLQDGGKAGGNGRTGQLGRRVVDTVAAAHRPRAERSHGRRLSGQAALRIPARTEMRQPPPKHWIGHRSEIHLPSPQERRERCQVDPVGVRRVRGETALQQEVVHERGDHRARG